MDRFIIRHRVVADIIFAILVGALCILVAQHALSIVEDRHIVRSEYAGTAIWEKEVYQGELFTITRMASGEKSNCTAHITRSFIDINNASHQIRMPSSIRKTVTELGIVKAEMTIPLDMSPGLYMYQANIRYECENSLLDLILGPSTYDPPPLLIEVKKRQE